MKDSPVRVLLIGAAGRMGKTVLDLAQSDREIEIAARCDLGDSIEQAMKNCDVAIDFSQADSIDEICRAAVRPLCLELDALLNVDEVGLGLLASVCPRERR
jgi:dihydrodipicolinate reductase